MKIIEPLVKQIKEEPVLFQAVIQAFLALVIGFGLIQMTEQQTGLILAFAAAALAFLTRRAVTPLADPRDKDGAPLVPAPVGNTGQPPVTTTPTPLAR